MALIWLSPLRLNEDFKHLFEAAPSLFLVLDPSFSIIAVTDAYLKATLKKREEILGRHIFDVFPDNPSDPFATGTTNLGASLERVLKTKVQDKMAIQKYDIQVPGKTNFEEKYWLPMNTPVLNRENEIQYIIHQVEDVSEAVDLKKQSEKYKRFNDQLHKEIEERKKIDEELSISEEKFKLLVELLPVGVWLLDVEGNIVYGNQAVNKIWKGKSFLSAVNFDQYRGWRLDGDQTRLKANDWAAAKAIKTGEAIIDEQIKIQRFDGEFGVILNSAVPLKKPDGTVLGALVVNQDITEQKAAEKEKAELLRQIDKEKRWLEAVFEGSSIGIIMINSEDPEHPVPNVYAKNIFGPNTDWFMGRTSLLGQVFDREGNPLSKDNLISSRILRGETIIGEELLLRVKNGKEFPIVIAGGPILDTAGKQIGGVAFFQDITPMKELEKLREEWSAVIAHDLRQPITAIQLSAGILKALPGFSEKINEIANMIESSAKQLNRMTHDLLDVSRLEANKLKLMRVDTDILALLDQIIKKLTPMFPDNAITLEVNQSISNLKIDPGRIEQVIGNLISNAVKYGFPGKPVILKIQQTEKRIEISVINQGVGIELKDQSKLFQRFHRTSQAKKEGIEGIGLGLYLTKGLVEAHGGHIEVESIPGKTTTFRIELPLEFEFTNLSR